MYTRGQREIQLARLGQVQGLAKIIDLEQRLLLFAGGGCEYGGVYEGKAIVVEESADGVDNGVADFADAPLALRAEVQVTVFE